MIWLVILSSFLSLSSEPCFQGFVVCEMGDPILFGDVEFLQNGKIISRTQTDFEGYYELCDVPTGIYDIRASYVGYETKTISDVEIKKGIKNVNITLSSGVMLSEITIVNYKVPLIKQNKVRGGGFRTNEQIKNLPVKDISSIVSETAGLSSKTDGDKVSIRGARTNQTNYYINGVRVNGTSATHKRKAKKATSSGYLPHAAQLTAGEWNPRQNHDEWEEFMNNKDMEVVMAEWGWKKGNLYNIRLLNQSGLPLIDEPVQVTNGDFNMRFRSDNSGLVQFHVPSGEKVTVKHQLTQKTLTSKKSDTLNIPVKCSDIETTLDLAFVMDITGSMGDELRYLQAEIDDVISNIQSDMNVDLRIGSSFFKEFSTGSKYESKNLSSNIRKAKDFILSQSAGGDGEYMQNSLADVVENFSWRHQATARIIFLILDFKYYEEMLDKDSIKKTLTNAAEKGIQIIPVTGSGIDRKMEFLMKWFATQTNGSYAFITSHGGVSSGHLDPSTHDYDIEHLNHLIIRMINERLQTRNCSEEEINDQTQCDQISLAPSITSHRTTISTPFAGSAVLINMDGKMVKNKRLQVGINELNVEGLSIGTYTLHIFSDQEVECYKKLIITDQNQFYSP